MEMETHVARIGFPSIRDSHGRAAQGIAAGITGGYSFLGGLILGQLACAFAGAGG